jgi:hypothetical protein
MVSLKARSALIVYLLLSAGCAAPATPIAASPKPSATSSDPKCVPRTESLGQGISIAETFLHTRISLGGPRFVTPDALGSDPFLRAEGWAGGLPPNKVGLLVDGELLDARLSGDGITLVVKHVALCSGPAVYGPALLLTVPKENSHTVQVTNCPAVRPTCSGPLPN